jgi:hypothetical protein
MAMTCTRESDIRFRIRSPGLNVGNYGQFPSHFENFLERNNDASNADTGLSNGTSEKAGEATTMTGGKKESLKTQLTDSFGSFSHDAGYDALMTSVVFLFQMNHILQQKQLRWANISGHTKNNTDTESSDSNQQNQSVTDSSTIALEQLFSTSVNKIRLVKTQPSVLDLSPALKNASKNNG